MTHGINGMMIIPLLVLLLLIVSFFAKVPGGVQKAAILLGLVVLQVFLGIFSHSIPFVVVLHVLNAFAILGDGARGRLAAPSVVRGRRLSPRWPSSLTRERRRLLIALVATVAVLAPLAYYWQASLLPDSYSVMDMGYADYGGGPETHDAPRPDGPQRRRPGGRPRPAGRRAGHPHRAQGAVPARLRRGGRRLHRQPHLTRVR